MLREIAARLGVQVDAGELATFMGALDVAKSSIAGLGTMLAGGAFALFTKHAIEAADSLGDTAGQLGVSTDELQKFSYGMLRAAGTSEGADRAIFLLTKSIGDAASGAGPAAQAFASLGINVKDASGHVGSALDILPAIAEAVKHAGSQAEKTAIATQFFGKATKTLIPYLDAGAEGVRGLAAEFDAMGGGTSAEFVEQAGIYNNETKKFDVSAKALTSSLMVRLMPAINTIMQWMIKGAAGAAKIGKETRLFQTAAAGLGLLLAAKMIPSLLGVYRSVMALRMGMFGLAMPTWIVIAGIAALYLIFDDLWSLMHGEGSVIGDLVESMGGVGAKTKLIEGLQIAWAAVTTTIKAVGKALSGVWDSMVAFAKDPSTLEAVTAIGNAIEGAWKSMVKLVKEVADFLKQASAPNSSTWEDLNNALGDDLNDLMGNDGKVKRHNGGFAASPMEYALNRAQLQAQGGAATGRVGDVNQANSITMPVNVNVTTTGTIDPKDQTKATREGLKEASDKLYLAAYNAVTRGDAAPAGGLPR